MDKDVETPAAALETSGPVARHRDRRRWALRAFVLSLLAAGAGALGVAAVAIVSDAKQDPAGRKAVSGVYMPDDSHFRDIAGQLLARKAPEPLQGITITGQAGKVTVLRYRPDRPSFLSAYLNPNALAVIARAIGAHSYLPITVDELRLEVLTRTGRQRWRLHGTQSGRLWRATINPNGTNLRLVAAAPGATRIDHPPE